MKSFMLKAVSVLAVVAVLIAILGWAIKVWYIRNYTKGPQLMPAAILDVDRNFSFPKNFPPDPGEKGKTTIEGIDADHDGVRDDVQRWIYAFVPNEPEKQMALRQTARYYQHSLRDDFGPEVRKTSRILVDRDVQCTFLNFKDELHGYIEENYLKAKILNTYRRTERYLKNETKHTTEEMSGEHPDLEQPCDNR